MNNQASGAGGALNAEYGAVMTVSGCQFLANEARAGGAANAAGERSEVIVSGCSWRGNKAEREGGGVRIFDFAVFSILSSTFEENYAGRLGGAAHSYQSTLEMANCSLARNSAGNDGGALRVSYDSAVTITDSHLTGNRAEYDGGAIAVDTAIGYNEGTLVVGASSPQSGFISQNTTALEVGSSNLDCYNTSFTFNTAGERGGTLYATQGSNVELEGCFSLGNSASLGGAVYMSHVTAQFTDSVFERDKVQVGAAMYLVDTVVKGVGMSFLDKDNTTAMLAVQVVSDSRFDCSDCVFTGWVGDNVVLKDRTGVVNLDRCDFRESRATKLVAAQDGGSPAFVRNAILGEGSYKASGYTPFNGSAFASNVAGCSSPSLTDCDGCVDGDVGVYCTCLVDVISDTKICFDESQGEVALTGQVEPILSKHPNKPFAFLALEGTGDTLDNILWEINVVRNPSNVEWTVVPNAGLLFSGETMMVRVEGTLPSDYNGEITSTFEAHTLRFQGEAQVSSVVVNATFYYCSEGEFWDDEEVECFQCITELINPEGVDCQDEGALLQTLQVKDGFWRATLTSKHIRQCFSSGACVGGNNVVSVEDYCRDGYTGPYCSVCDEGWSHGVSHTCHECTSAFRAGMLALLSVVVVIMVVLVYILMSDLMSNPALTDLIESRSVVVGLIRKVPFHKLKIPIVVCQIITQYASITAIEFPPVFQTFLSTLDLLNLDIGWLLSTVCVIKVNFYTRLVVVTVGPLLLLLALGITFLCATRKLGLRPFSVSSSVVTGTGHDLQMPFGSQRQRLSPGSSSEGAEASVLERVKDKHNKVILVVAFLLYSTVSTVIFQTFTCDNLDDGESYLRADYRITCGTDAHRAHVIYASWMILVYPIGIPVMYAVLLYRKRKLIYSKDVYGEGPAANPDYTTRRLQDRRITHIAPLWEAYRPKRYYYEVVECMRRILLTGCLVFILPNTAGQAAVACVLSASTIVAFALLRPFIDPRDHKAYVLGALTIFLTMFMGLVIKVDVSNEDARSQFVLSVLLICMIMFILASAVVECVLDVRRLSNKSQAPNRHIFLRREVKPGEGLEDEDSHKNPRHLYAPKLSDVPMQKAEGSGFGSGQDKASAYEGGIPRGRAAFFMSSTGGGGGGIQKGMIPSGGGGSFDVFSNSNRSSFQGLRVGGTPAHSAFPVNSGGHGGVGAGGGEDLIDSQKSNSPNDDFKSLEQVPSGAAAAGHHARVGSGEKLPKIQKRSARSSRRKGGGKKRGAMRPAVPAAGPDEMRPSPGPGNREDGGEAYDIPWGT
ncbi:unnamed protein product [Discosporangium mesarthrocarpum]